MSDCPKQKSLKSLNSLANCFAATSSLCVPNPAILHVQSKLGQRRGALWFTMTSSWFLCILVPQARCFERKTDLDAYCESNTTMLFVHDSANEA